jgi:hypothetical protein
VSDNPDRFTTVRFYKDGYVGIQTSVNRPDGLAGDAAVVFDRGTGKVRVIREHGEDAVGADGHPCPNHRMAGAEEYWERFQVMYYSAREGFVPSKLRNEKNTFSSFDNAAKTATANWLITHFRYGIFDRKDGMVIWEVPG